MKLLGVRFGNFARFEECFVPLSEGVHLLVGRNNAGKTALLRGLTALSAIPVAGGPLDPSSSMDQGLREYCRNDSPDDQAFFNLDILFTAEPSNSEVLGDLSQSSAVRCAADLVVEYNFQVFVKNRRVVFVGAALICDKKKFPLTEDSNRLKLYNTVGREVGQRAVTAGFFACLTGLRNIRLVDAHRVVRPYNLQPQNLLGASAESLAPFLDSLHGDFRDTFNKIEQFVISVFPEFKYVNTRKQQGTTAFVTLTRANDNSMFL